MKKSAHYKTIDGYRVINAIVEATSDPAATLEAVRLRVEALPETARAKAVAQKIIAQRNVVQAEAARAGDKRKADTRADISAEEAKAAQAQANIAVLETELAPLTAAIEAAHLSLYEECAVYFEKDGEKILTEAEEADMVPKLAAIQAEAERVAALTPEQKAAEKQARLEAAADEVDPVLSLQGHAALTLEGEIIPDWRGTEYHIKTAGTWAKAKAEHIGEALPGGAVPSDALTDAQRSEIAAQAEAERVAALAPEERAAEKQARIKAVIREAVTRKQEADLEAEVNGTPAEFDPVTWVRERKNEIEAKYA
jgi:hypothetical protein